MLNRHANVKKAQFASARRAGQDSDLRIDWSNRRVLVNGESIKLLPRYFALYCLLYVMRFDDPQKDGGFVEGSSVQQLPGWEKGNQLSVAKQISRHFEKLSQQGYHLIETIQKTYGPFRLTVKKTNLHSDVTTDTLCAYVFGSLVRPLTGGDEWDFYRYVHRMCDGVLHLDDGQLVESLAEFQASAQSAPRPYLRAVALQNAARILERLGRYEEALAVTRESLGVLSESRQYRDWGEARSFAIEGVINYRMGKLDDAERLYRRALASIRGTGQLRILGEIYNGLGNIAAARNLYNEALPLYQQALEQWMLIENLDGIQSLFFNIGRLYLRWAKQLEKIDSKRTTDLRRTAEQWLTQAVELGARAGIGYYDNDAQIGLASLYRRTNQFKKALNLSEEALRIAQRSGNARGIRNAFRSLLKVYLATGNRDKGKKLLDDASAKLSTKDFEELKSITKDQLH